MCFPTIYAHLQLNLAGPTLCTSTLHLNPAPCTQLNPAPCPPPCPPSCTQLNLFPPPCTLQELAESSHQLMMITGDAPLTACFAASQVHIVTRPVVILSNRSEHIGQMHGSDKVRRCTGAIWCCSTGSQLPQGLGMRGSAPQQRPWLGFHPFPHSTTVTQKISSHWW